MFTTYIDHHNNSQKSFRKIFAFIIGKGKTTRRDIQKYTNYSWSSVSSVVSVLINNGYVIETDSINGGVGRNASYIVPNGDKYVCIGLDINSIGFSLSVIGIDGSIKYGASYPYSIQTKEFVMDTIFKAIDDAIAFIGESYNLVSIGISCQGIVDNTHSIFTRFHFCDDFSNVNLKEILEERYNVYTYLEHDTNCMLEAYSYNYGVANESVGICRVVSGIGFAICVNGKSIEEFGSIDFGHMIVQPKDSPQCSCGRYGCLEAYASSTGITRRAGVEDFSIVDKDREKYRDILNDAAYYLGITLGNIKQIFDLNKMVITGNVIGDDDFFLEQVILASKIFAPKVIKINYIKDLNAAYGAARLSLINKVDLKGEI